jgi:hypothetical protein
LLGSKGWGERKGLGIKGRGRGKGGVMTQSLYVHVNKGNIKTLNIS